MSAEDHLNVEQFKGRGWTPEQEVNMAKLDRMTRKSAKSYKGTDAQNYGGINGLVSPVKSPSNW